MSRLVVVLFLSGPAVEYGPFRGALRVDYESDGALRISVRGRWGVGWRTHVYHPAADSWACCQVERAEGEADAARLERIARYELTRSLPPP